MAAVLEVLRFRELEAFGHQFRDLGLEYSVPFNVFQLGEQLGPRGVRIHSPIQGFESQY